MNYSQLLKELQNNVDVKYKEFNDKIVNANVPSLGCRMPYLRKLAKKLTVEDVVGFPVHANLETDTLTGMVIANSKLPFVDKAPLLQGFADTIENWAVCDCNTVKVGKKESEQYFVFFLDLVKSDKPFVCRYGLVNLMGSYLDEQHIDDVFAALSMVVCYGHYYVDMAVAWLVATAAAKCRDKTFAYLHGDGRKVLNVFTYNKALQKMRDSYRISAEEKAATYALKRTE